ncbi:hypothetical protein Aduo_008413 [Ancylostoma duodenale]
MYRHMPWLASSICPLYRAAPGLKPFARDVSPSADLLDETVECSVQDLHGHASPECLDEAEGPAVAPGLVVRVVEVVVGQP